MINVIVAGNRTLIQEGISSILSSTDDISIQGYAESDLVMSDLMNEFKVDVIISDHNFINDFDLKDLVKRTRIYGTARFLVVSDYHHKNEIQELINAGITSHVSNECSRSEFIEAVYMTARVENFLCSHMRRMLFGNKLIAKESDNIPSLSDRETEIIQLISIGLSNKEIAERLFLSFHTIKTHRKNIIKKLGFTFKNASELALLISYLNDIVI